MRVVLFTAFLVVVPTFAQAFGAVPGATMRERAAAAMGSYQASLAERGQRARTGAGPGGLMLMRPGLPSTNAAAIQRANGFGLGAGGRLPTSGG